MLVGERKANCAPPKEKYFGALKELIRDNFLKTQQYPYSLSPFGQLEMLGRVLRFPAGGAMSSTESKQKNPPKIDLITGLLEKGEKVHLRGHAQIEASRLDILYGDGQMGQEIEITDKQLKDALHYTDFIGKKDSSSSSFEYMGAYHCGGLQGMGPVGGVQGALKQTGETIKRLIDKLGKDTVKEKMANGDLTIGVELPGDLTIYLTQDAVDGTKLQKEYTYRIGYDTEKLAVKNKQDGGGYWFICVDERVGGGELVEQGVGPGSVFPHAAVVIGLADSHDSDSLVFAASLGNVTLQDPISPDPEPTSAGLRYVMPGLGSLAGEQAKDFAQGIANLWELLCTEMLAHSGTSGNQWQIGIKGSEQKLPLYRPSNWDQLKNILSFHHGTIAVAALKGKISPDIISALRKHKIPLIEI